jgi:hypothetical protein
VLLADLESGLTGGLSGTGGGATGTTGSSGAGSGYQTYAQCIQSAAGDIGKMQKCAPLLGGG